MKQIFLVLLTQALLFCLTAHAGQKPPTKVPPQVAAKFQRIWQEERTQRMHHVKRGLCVSGVATYVFALAGIATHFDWMNENMGAYFPVFFNLSLASAGLTGYYYAQYQKLLNKKRLSNHEMYGAYQASCKRS